MQRILPTLRSAFKGASRIRHSSVATHGNLLQEPTRPFCGISQGRLLRLFPSPSSLSRFPRSRTLDRAFLSSEPSWPSPARRRVLTHQRVSISRDGYAHFGNGFNSGNRGSSTNVRYLVGFSAAGIAVYVYLNLDYAPFTGRTRLLGISKHQELALGKETFEDLLQSFHGRILHPSSPESKRIRRIVSRIAGTVFNIDPRLCEGFAWQTIVVAEDEPNALCVPGGRILITTGLLKILPTDNDVAIVLAHEIAHAINRHGAESMHLQRMIMPIVFILNQVFDMRWLPSLLFTFFLSLPYARGLEYEADEVGLLLCAESCYDPRVAPGVFRRLGELQNEKSGTFMADKLAPFLSTHPQTRERAARLKAAVPAKMERFNDKCTVGSSVPQFVQDYQGFQYSDPHQYK